MTGTVAVRWRHRLGGAALMVVCGLGVATAWALAQDRPERGRTTPTVLFMCPHGAAKSVLASAYFQRAAEERGLRVRVMSAGTDPDPEIAPAVAGHLEKHGYAIPAARPRRATAGDIAAADVVISIGCDLTGFPAPRGTLVRWDDVPSPSEDFARADETIRAKVVQLVEDLVRRQQQQQQ